MEATDLLIEYLINESLVDSIKMYRCPDLSDGAERNKLDLTNLASKIIQTKRNDLCLLNQASIEDISLNFKSKPQNFAKVEALLKHIVKYAQNNGGNYTMGFLNFYPSYKKIVDLKKEIENKVSKAQLF